MHRALLPSASVIAVAAALCLSATGALAQQSQHRTNLLDLKLGTPAAALPEEAFIDYACGTNGGPPGKALGSFADFAQCPPEPSGLHEVTFRYDDELEYRALARGQDTVAEMNGGTVLSSYPIYASALFDDAGVLRGLRAATDDRSGLYDRTNAYLLADYVQNVFGHDGFTCTDRAPANGEAPLAGTYVNQSCSKTADGTLVYTEAHLFLKNGQTEVNKNTGRINRGQFDSSSRIEIREAGAPLDAAGKPL